MILINEFIRKGSLAYQLLNVKSKTLIINFLYCCRIHPNNNRIVQSTSISFNLNDTILFVNMYMLIPHTQSKIITTKK